MLTFEYASWVIYACSAFSVASLIGISGQRADRYLLERWGEEAGGAAKLGGADMNH